MLRTVLQAVCPQPQSSVRAREDTTPYPLRAVDINHFALIRPILWRFNQSGTHGILSNVIPLLRITFIIAQQMIEKTGLPKNARRSFGNASNTARFSPLTQLPRRKL